ncbi:two-component system sensor histidine kinase DesK [Micromonospora kangleipakensis]|uniref:Two-component system sensor histidine kinase DesK n=1 Tax=Micromonospora kangleipakensis TaxID=1077942 RepID=A0A4Q8BGT0_9ACTN|nr:histidine kinase [Micromonospora kangleipakensis]RZU76439.1 two-component system sensor histidine kinase DesK [Micromonospora kangleipakensis]
MTVGTAGADRRLRRARQVTLASLATSLWTSLLLPGVGLTREPDPVRLTLGAVGVAAFAVAQAGVLYAAVTPWLAQRWRHRFEVAFALVAALSVPLVGPVAAGRWPTWAWLGASLVGMTPLLLRSGAALAAALTVVTSLAVAAWTGGPVGSQLAITGGVGAGIAAVNWVQVWFWDLLVEARQGHDARARLAAAEERLRFARDVHDLLGHDLTVIALKAELAARLAPVDAGRAGREAAEVQRLAGSALHRVREAVHGYRTVDLSEQLAAVREVLRSCGVRCDVVRPPGELPAGAAAELGAVLREAATNVLRHSRAGWCRIEISWDGAVATVTVSNDGVDPHVGPDGHSHGLRGLAERLASTGGVSSPAGRPVSSPSGRPCR